MLVRFASSRISLAVFSSSHRSSLNVFTHTNASGSSRAKSDAAAGSSQLGEAIAGRNVLYIDNVPRGTSPDEIKALLAIPAMVYSASLESMFLAGCAYQT
jgi:hypothetical protein